MAELKLAVGENGATDRIFARASEVVELLERVKLLLNEIKNDPIKITLNGETFKLDLDGEV